MHVPIAVGAVLASVTAVSAQACAQGTAQQIKGNWYCSAVDSISYTNFGSSGTYNQIIGMDGGKCTSSPKEYKGPLAPLNEEVSWHFRGPLQLKKFAYYTPGSIKLGGRDVKPSFHARRHGHAHKHGHAAQEKRGLGDIVTATIDGKVVTWANDYDGGAAPTPAPGSGAPPKLNNKKVNKGGDSEGTPASPHKSSPSINAGLGKWARQAYYDAESGTAEGLTFLNHHGGEGSGTFDNELGNSLSYASTDGCSGSSSSTVLGNKMIPDNKEVVIMSDKQCKGGSCGTVRPGSVAYHGFGGESKLFLLEFSMPLTGKTGWNEDMPAAWILNAQIPRTTQYGKADCNCWKSGCGELDILEVLDSGNTRCKSTLHGNISGGDSNYFKRPTDGPIKVAVVFNGDGSSAHIKILKEDYGFEKILNALDVSKISLDAALSSIFKLGS